MFSFKSILQMNLLLLFSIIVPVYLHNALYIGYLNLLICFSNASYRSPHASHTSKLVKISIWLSVDLLLSFYYILLEKSIKQTLLIT